ncbi:MAG: NAD(P)/FAD-dependent oxidoreductase, partial [Anaerolineales bacterium]|nr:NAD(P)/FAD-dependent oxidoreductase [Anaerolineales bacterium]
MKHYQVIIVGGGPAGSACAAKLVKAGVDCLVLDKEKFPRQKLCAGWITPRVFADIGVNPDDYPHDLTEFPRLKIYFNGFPISLPGKQYAIRRIEFDDWLLKRSGVEVIQHEVKQIHQSKSGFSIDDRFRADYLIGAGGTYCPVHRNLFKDHSVRTGAQIISLEEEYQGDMLDPFCRLWFFRNRLPGYAWYVPKTGGYINIGIGANAEVLKESGSTIQEHWNSFVDHLLGSGLVEQRHFKPGGYTYYLQGTGEYRLGDKIFLVGDSAGLATLDMGEGIGPAIRSGILAAR